MLTEMEIDQDLMTTFHAKKLGVVLHSIQCMNELLLNDDMIQYKMREFAGRKDGRILDC